MASMVLWISSGLWMSIILWIPYFEESWILDLQIPLEIPSSLVEDWSIYVVWPLSVPFMLYIHYGIL